MIDSFSSTPASLTRKAGVSPDLQQEIHQVGDQAWIEVIQRMDEIYADLVNSQVKLEEKNTELENAHRFIESILSSMSEILIVCDINGKILQINQALSKTLDFTLEALEGSTLARLFSQQDQALVAQFPQQIRSGSLIDCEVDLLDRQQQPVPMSINCSALFNHKDQLSGMVITGRPLGELRKAYEELQQAHEELKTAQQQLIQSEKMASLGRLVAGVAHELNNPISFVFANMHALQSYQSRFQQYFDAIHQNLPVEEREKLRRTLGIDRMMKDLAPLIEGSMEGAERVSDIVKNLRKFATPQTQPNQELDLVEVVRRATSWVLKASPINIDLTEDFPDSIHLVNNEGYIHQILINLIQNAVDAMNQTTNPQLHIHIREQQEQVRIIIEDNGSGIPEENLSKIFDPFFTTKTVGKGTGLGLSISFGLATDQCQGNLQAENRLDGGARFILTLPLEIN